MVRVFTDIAGERHFLKNDTTGELWKAEEKICVETSDEGFAYLIEPSRPNVEDRRWAIDVLEWTTWTVLENGRRFMFREFFETVGQADDQPKRKPEKEGWSSRWLSERRGDAFVGTTELCLLGEGVSQVCTLFFHTPRLHGSRSQLYLSSADLVFLLSKRAAQHPWQQRRCKNFLDGFGYYDGHVLYPATTSKTLWESSK